MTRFQSRFRYTVSEISASLNGELVRRLLGLYIILGLTPILAFIVAPIVYHLMQDEVISTSTLQIQLVISGIVFIVVVFIGGVVTLRRLALPIQALAQGAEAIARGDLAHRIPRRTSGDDELITLIDNFNNMAAAIQEMRDGMEKQRVALEETLTSLEKEFAVTNGIAELANSQTDLLTTLSSATGMVRDGLGLDLLSISLIDDSDDLYCVASSCEPEYREELARHCRSRLDDDLIRQAVDARTSIKASDIDWDNLNPELRRSYARLNVTNIGIVPIMYKNRSLGAMVLMRQPGNPVPEHKIALLHALTRHIAILIDNIQLQEQLRALSILNERRRLASELHDSVTQSLFTMNLTAEGLKASVKQDCERPRIRDGLEMLMAQARHIETEIRSLINELRPVELENETLSVVLRRHAASLQRISEIDVAVSIKGDTDQVPVAIQRNINRIAQEAMSNIARHAHAHTASIDLCIADDVVQLQICDDGDGFDLQEKTHTTSQSLGLLSMRERAEMMGGALLVRSEPGNGTRITVKIPLNEGIYPHDG